MKSLDRFNYTYKKLRTKILQKLQGMQQRCNNKRNPGYSSYGQKGIKVCSLWTNHPEAFIGWCLEQNYEPKLHIHRLNPHKDYEPDNCILCHPDEHRKLHSLISASQREYKNDFRIHDGIQELLVSCKETNVFQIMKELS